MPITNLTNTSWAFQVAPEINTAFQKSINFTLPNGEVYDTIRTYKFTHSGVAHYFLQYRNTSPWALRTIYVTDEQSVPSYNRPSSTWGDRRELTITGGSDVTDPELIAFFETFATQIFPTYIATEADLTAVADAIRTKGGTSASLEFPSGFVDAIQNITTPIPSNYGRIEYDGSILTVS